MLLCCDPAHLAPLARAAARGDADALEPLARALQPVLARLVQRALSRALRSGLDRDDVADEVVAEVQAFLAGAGGAPGWTRFSAARCGGDVEAWLYGIVRNKVRRRLRDARRREQAIASALEPEPTALPPDRAVDAARAVELARTLPAREQMALALWMQDASSREIAARLRFASPHAVDCVLARGKQRLRRMMLGDGLALDAA